VHIALALSFSEIYTSRDLRIYLVGSLIVPIFFYSDVVYFPSLTGAEFRRLELAFNACTMRYVYGLRRFEFSRGILGCTYCTRVVRSSSFKDVFSFCSAKN
jgi:hypothetical protein